MENMEKLLGTDCRIRQLAKEIDRHTPVFKARCLTWKIDEGAGFAITQGIREQMGSGMSIDLLAPAWVDHVRGKGVRVSVRGLSENGGEGLPKGGVTALRQVSEPFEHEGGVDGGEDRFEDGRLEQPRTLPVLDLRSKRKGVRSYNHTFYPGILPCHGPPVTHRISRCRLSCHESRQCPAGHRGR